ncbi:hypothetical protein Rrhod_1009 [Rhodococcus rhodnii LMG 5362]|uniref:Uncharacterized protein n=1 Tax=Rhodococcus rhodnii LMG 5362 TaxID=1273125 RepID=R7WTX0_9NOCA|nr:hypothetical protein Rrhod_1009 [Rhodococcus rhodnii LMG 5362]
MRQIYFANTFETRGFDDRGRVFLTPAGSAPHVELCTPPRPTRVVHATAIEPEFALHIT